MLLMHTHYSSGQECWSGENASFLAECSLATAAARWEQSVCSVSSERTGGQLLT